MITAPPSQRATVLAPFSSQVLIIGGPAELIFADGFDGGSTSGWF